jgi:LysM repeat protein
MAASGSPFETPRACPFVALELDRDRRSDRPDYRHRCFAEPTPAPRSIAHQEAYCLSPNFAACPVFQDWAVRAAARPAATPAPATVITSAAAAGGASPMRGFDAPPPVDAAPAVDSAPHVDTSQPVDAAPPMEQPETAPAAPAPMAPPPGSLPEDVSVVAPSADSLGAPRPTFATTGWADDDAGSGSEQLGVFDAVTDAPRSSLGEPDAGYVEPPFRPQPAAAPMDGDDSPAVPAFLTGRTPRPLAAPADFAATAAAGAAVTSAAGSPPPRPPLNPARDDIVPSWEIDGRYGAEGPENPGGNRLDTILTAIAVLAILALGVAAVIFLPGLLSKGGPHPSNAPASLGAPSAAPSGLFTPVPTLASTIPPSSVAPSSPGPSVAPVGSPRFYKIKPGDSLARIARHFDVTIEDILAANPQVQDADHIEVGQILVIPQPTVTPAP